MVHRNVRDFNAVLESDTNLTSGLSKWPTLARADIVVYGSGGVVVGSERCRGRELWNYKAAAIPPREVLPPRVVLVQIAEGCLNGCHPLIGGAQGLKECVNLCSVLIECCHYGGAVQRRVCGGWGGNGERRGGRHPWGG